jgi:hypothetical protein
MMMMAKKKMIMMIHDDDDDDDDDKTPRPKEIRNKFLLLPCFFINSWIVITRCLLLIKNFYYMISVFKSSISDFNII